MKRRQAIKHVVILSSAAVLLPACRNEPVGPSYENVSLDGKQMRLLEQFANALLPKEKTEITTPETTADFILTVLNDCYSPEDIHKFKAGLHELQASLSKDNKPDFGVLDQDKQKEIFNFLSTSEGVSEPLSFFYETSRKLAIEHFTSSPFFMKNIMNWEFAPGYFRGCVPV